MLSITCDSGLQILVYSGPLILPPGRLLTIYQPGLVFSAETSFTLNVKHVLQFMMHLLLLNGAQALIFPLNIVRVWHCWI